MQLRIGKTVFRIGFPFAAAVTLMLLLDKSGAAVSALVCCVLHELGHLLCLFALSAPPERVTLGAFGMRIDKSSAELSYLHEAITALAGPLINFLLALILFVVSKFIIAPWLLTSAALNLCTGLFNLIPVEPLDGGRALKNALLIRFDEQRTEKIINVVSLITLIPLTLGGIAVLKFSGYNFTLLLVCIYIAAYLLMKNRAGK
ncbi:MAG: site-2 protease family protein [Clostridia bacterium]|nr:site-2 protease family protein [Clostridia bacterium]